MKIKSRKIEKGLEGRCQDKECAFGDEPVREGNYLHWVNMRWVCDGCLEAHQDGEKEYRANRADELGL